MPRLGRPKKDEAERRSAQLSIRIPASLRKRLDAARLEAETPRSLSQEIEYRLRRSFEDPEQKVKERFGSLSLYWLFRVAGNLIRNLERFTGEPWWRNPYTHQETKRLINWLLDRGKPAGRATTPRRFAAMGKSLGQHLAEREFVNIQVTLLDPDPPIGWNWGGMTVTEWREAAEVFKGKLSLERPKQ